MSGARANGRSFAYTHASPTRENLPSRSQREAPVAAAAPANTLMGAYFSRRCRGQIPPPPVLGVKKTLNVVPSRDLYPARRAEIRGPRKRSENFIRAITPRMSLGRKFHGRDARDDRVSARREQLRRRQAAKVFRFSG